MKEKETDKKDSSSKPTKKKGRPPALSPRSKELDLILLAYEVAEEQLRNRTASSQIITQILKLGTERELLEKLKLEQDIELSRAKKESLTSQASIKELYENALLAMKTYSGSANRRDADEDD